MEGVEGGDVEPDDLDWLVLHVESLGLSNFKHMLCSLQHPTAAHEAPAGVCELRKHRTEQVHCARNWLRVDETRFDGMAFSIEPHFGLTCFGTRPLSRAPRPV